MSVPTSEVLAEFVGFAQALRRAGVAAARTELFVAALDSLDPMRRDDVYWAGRATLCASPDDIEIYERLFAEWFSGVNVGRVPASDVVTVPQASGGDDNGDEGSETEDVTMLASAAEVLRHRDVAELSGPERRDLARLFARLPVTLPLRPVRRKEPYHRGELDVGAMVRQHLRKAGEPSRLRFRRRRLKPRRLVFLIDISRSTAAYADHNLRLAHRFSQIAANRVEAFTVGTRLTRVTRALRVRDPDMALEAAGRVIPDWSGGTRLGEALEAFITRWGRRGVARGAVVVIMSDGWERGDVTLLRDQMRQLQRLVYATVWVNPHRGKAGFEPIQSGMAAVLPYVDRLIAGHTFATFEDVAKTIAEL